MNAGRMLRVTSAAALALLLTACAGLPTSGPVTNGLPVGEAQTDTEFTQVATGPVRGWSPEQIVAGFLEASISPADGWSIAQQFLSPDLADSWVPGSGVTIDANVSSRSYQSSIEDVEEAEEGTVVVDLDQVASVDSGGGYSEATGSTTLPFSLGRNDDGEWRITEAPDGVVIDQAAFEQVFASYALQYFDRSWSRLVPDLRWYPKTNVATRITRTILENGPAEWLLPAVQSAFPADVALARAAVPIDGQVAEVELNEAALSLDTVTLARMRTQLQASLKPAGIAEVRFTVNGRTVDAQTVPIAGAGAENSTLVLTEDGFGGLVGGELSSVSGISEQIEQIEQPITAIDMAEDQEFAAVRLSAGGVLAVTDGRVDPLDERAGLIRPSVDPLGYVWTVPASDPLSLKAWATDVSDAEVEGFDVKGAWPAASAISALRVAADGTRLAAVVTLGGHQSVVVAAIVRDDSGNPTGLGPVKELADVRAGGVDLSWLGSGELAVLISGDDSVLITQPVGGPGATAAAPAGAEAIAGAAERNGLRLLGAEGVLYAPRASVWQEYFSGVLVLGTRAGL
ncbi:LpqB family beta-propeller domain-containing protein [Microbacterium tumbae]